MSAKGQNLTSQTFDFNPLHLLAAYQEGWTRNSPGALRERLCGVVNDRLLDAQLHFLGLALEHIGASDRAVAHHVKE
jgi:hypothetical protein